MAIFFCRATTREALFSVDWLIEACRNGCFRHSLHGTSTAHYLHFGLSHALRREKIRDKRCICLGEDAQGLRESQIAQRPAIKGHT